MPFLRCISSFEGAPLKICTIQLPDLLFVVVFVTFYIYHFFKNLENVKWKGKRYKTFQKYKKMVDTSFIYNIFVCNLL